ncbi:hypothetical protein Mapa_015746 [Marchantia paleacea]|nr:hypothetical protein Mapa_015746 [Marchantia paleacea]
MMGPKGKETASGGRFGLPGVGADVMRVFNRALELVSSNSVDSENELLDLVKRAKRETEKEPFNLPKKSRPGRGPETSELQALGTHRVAAGPSADHATSQQAAAGPDGSSTAAGATATGNANMTQAQTRLMNVIRGGPGRGRIEKPKRKVTR